MKTIRLSARHATTDPQPLPTHRPASSCRVPIAPSAWCLLLTCSLASAAEVPRLDRGDTDIGIAFEGGALDVHVHHEVTDTEYPPSEVVLVVGAAAAQLIPAGAAFSFLGKPGEPTWILPGVEQPNLLFLGLAAEEVAEGAFVGNEVRLSLRSIEGPGQVALYAVDGFGQPQVRWQSGDGLTDADVFTLVAGGHQHANWAFSRAGTYRLGLQASGTLVEGNQAIVSGVVTCQFEVGLEEPSLRLSRREDGTLVLTAGTRDGVGYQVQSASRVTGPWEDSGGSFVGTGAAHEVRLPLGDGTSFFRVVRR